MIIEVKDKAELKKELSSDIGTIIIKFPVSKPKEIVEMVLKYRDKAEVWIKTPLFPRLSKNGYLIFKKGAYKPYLLKRGFDIFVSVLAIILLSPVFAGVAILIKCTSKSSKEPVIFKHQRLSNYKPFLFYKFRTMEYSNDSEIHYEYMKKSIRGEARGKVYKLVDDPRVTSAGKWLRRVSLDEIPQFINVLRGDMSLIGPRPPIPYEVNLYEDWQKVRFTAKPGMTGLWQVLGRSLLSFNEMVVLDLFYATNISFKLDLYILINTVPAVFFLRGAY